MDVFAEFEFLDWISVADKLFFELVSLFIDEWETKPVDFVGFAFAEEIAIGLIRLEKDKEDDVKLIAVDDVPIISNGDVPTACTVEPIFCADVEDSLVADPFPPINRPLFDPFGLVLSESWLSSRKFRNADWSSVSYDEDVRSPKEGSTKEDGKSREPRTSR